MNSANPLADMQSHFQEPLKITRGLLGYMFFPLTGASSYQE